MTVKDLMERLQHLPGDVVIVWDESEDPIEFVSVKTLETWDVVSKRWVGGTVVAFA